MEDRCADLFHGENFRVRHGGAHGVRLGIDGDREGLVQVEAGLEAERGLGRELFFCERDMEGEDMKIFVEADGDELFLSDDGELGDGRGLREDDALVKCDLRANLEHVGESIHDMRDRGIHGGSALVHGDENDDRQRDENEADAEIMLHEKGKRFGEAPLFFHRGQL